MKRKIIQWLGSVGLMVVAMSGCEVIEESGVPGSAASMANGRILWVDEASATFGYYRLEQHERRYEELGIFLQQKGRPDFLAETDDAIRRYLILYYVKTKQAYLCRTRAVDPKHLEFSGPYRITPNELRMLKAMKGS